jgi:hypothetical protein
MPVGNLMRMRAIKQRPRGSSRPWFILFAFLDDSLAARTVIVFLLDDGRAVCRLTFLDYGVTFTNPVTVVIAALTNGHSGAAWADANTYANFVRECRRGEDTQCSNYQCVFHQHLLFVLSTRGNPAVSGKFPKSMQIDLNFHLAAPPDLLLPRPRLS